MFGSFLVLNGINLKKLSKALLVLLYFNLVDMFVADFVEMNPVVLYPVLHTDIQFLNIIYFFDFREIQHG